MQENELKKHIKKIHRNVGHKSEKQLNLLFRMAKQTGPNITATLWEVIEECEVCKRYKKTPPRPRIAMAKANTANEVVSLDLSEFRDKNKYILYMCDEFSAYMKAKVIKDKKPSTIIKAFNNVWIEDGPGNQVKVQ